MRVAFGRHKHPRFDTYTVQNGIEIEAPGRHAGARRSTRARSSSPTASAATACMVVLDHGGKHHTLYAHLGGGARAAGPARGRGRRAGHGGATALEGPGLYFEMRFQGRPEDPLDWLS